MNNIVEMVKINISPGYRIEVFAQGLDSPISMFFTEKGDMVVAESGFDIWKSKSIITGQWSIRSDSREFYSANNRNKLFKRKHLRIP